MVAIATGGFSMYDAGMLNYNNAVLEALLIPVMIAGSLPVQAVGEYLDAGSIVIEGDIGCTAGT